MRTTLAAAFQSARALAVTGTLCIHAAGWPGFRGGPAQGVAEGARAPIHFGASSNLLWKVDLLPGHSSPVVWGHQVYITGSDGNNLTTLSFDRHSGKKLWEKAVAVDKLEPIHKSNSHASPTPVADGKGVYVYFGSFGLLAYDPAGKELWRKPLPIPKTFFNQGSSTSPILAEGKLLVFVQRDKDSHLLALDPTHGVDLWKAPMPDYHNSWSSPIIWKESDRGLVGLACASRFTAFSLADGRERWWLNNIGYQASTTPVAVGDRLIIASAGVQGDIGNMTPPPTFEEAIKSYDQNADGLIDYEEIPKDLLFTDRHAAQGQGNMSVRQALGMFGGVKKGEKLDQARYSEIRESLIGFRTGPMNRTVVLSVRTGGQGDVTESHVTWRETRGVPEVPSPLVSNGRLYLVRSGGFLVCAEVSSGKQVYENRMGSPGGYFASPVLAGGRLYVASDRGTVTVIKAGDTFEVLARNELGDPISASPAIVDDHLYVRTAGALWAFRDQGGN